MISLGHAGSVFPGIPVSESINTVTVSVPFVRTTVPLPAPGQVPLTLLIFGNWTNVASYCSVFVLYCPGVIASGAGTFAFVPATQIDWSVLGSISVKPLY